MHILHSSKQQLKTLTIGLGSVILLAAPAATFANGMSGGNGSSSSHGRSANGRTVAATPSKNTSQHGNNFGFNKQTCDQRQANLNWQAANAQSHDQKRLTGLNIMLSGVQTYVSGGTVTIANYDSLNAQAMADQTAATTAVNAIAAPQLNCDDTTAAANSDSNFKHDAGGLNSTIANANKALATYRMDVSKLFKAALNS